MAHKKGVGSTDNGRDSNPKYLGVKLFGGQAATAGNIIVRQRGTKFHPGDNVYMGRDYTLHAKVDGTVVFRRRRGNRTYVSILPVDEAVAAATRPIVGNAGRAVQPARRRTPSDAPPAQPVAENAGLGVAAAAVSAAAASVETSDDTEADTGLGADTSQGDDLKRIEGIGPKIESLLNDGGFTTFAELAAADVEKIQAILDEAGPRYRVHNPGTWQRQAILARDGKWDELDELQDALKGGKE